MKFISKQQILIFIKYKKVILLCIFFIFLSGCSKKEEITISVASSLYEPINQIVKIYEKENNQKVIINSGSSGSLKKQIENGTEIDVFFSANENYINELIHKDLIKKENVFYPISNSLVLVKNKNFELNKKELETNKNKNLENIKVSIGDTNTVPLGIYSKEYLENEKIFDELKQNIIYGKDANSVKNYVENFNVDVGIIYKSDSLNLKNSEVVFEIPKDKHSQIKYAISSITEEGKSLTNFIVQNKEIFKKYGFDLIEEDESYELKEISFESNSVKNTKINKLFSKSIINALVNSVIITFSAVLISLLLALFIIYKENKMMYFNYKQNKLIVNYAIKEKINHKKYKYKKHKDTIIETLILLPVFLPPSAIGYIILLSFSKNNEFGKLLSNLGIEIIFSKLGGILVSVIVTLPIFYQSIKNNIKLIDKEIIEASRVCGGNDFEIFTKIILPLSKKGILIGIILSVARSFGEFGATILVAGNIEGKTQTLPMLLYSLIESNQIEYALIVLFIIIIISIFMISLYKKLDERE